MNKDISFLPLKEKIKFFQNIVNKHKIKEIDKSKLKPLKKEPIHIKEYDKPIISKPSINKEKELDKPTYKPEEKPLVIPDKKPLDLPEQKPVIKKKKKKVKKVEKEDMESLEKEFEKLFK
jgi:hypothetical protein